MSKLMRVLALLIAGMSQMFALQAAYGMGWGHPVGQAVLGEVLSLTVPLQLSAGESVKEACLSADVYFGDEKVAESAVLVQPMLRPSGDPAVRVRTLTLIDNPAVTVKLSAGCQSRMSHQFTLFTDPAAVVPASAPAIQAQGATQVDTPLKAAVSAPTVPVAARTWAAGLQPGHQTAQTSPSGHRTAGAPRVRQDKPARSVPTVAPLPEGNLTLDPIEVDALIQPPLHLSAGLSASAPLDDRAGAPRRRSASLVWQALRSSPEQTARDRQRISDLEKRLAQLTIETEQTRGAAIIQAARSQQSSARADRGWLIWVWACVALCATAAAFYFRHQGRRGQHHDEVPAVPPVDGEAIEAGTGLTGSDLPGLPPQQGSAPEAASPHVPTASPEPVIPQSASPEPTAPEPVLAHADGTSGIELERAVDSPVAAAPPTASSGPLPSSHAVVEELIDLAQQVEFYQVLEQDDAAARLLQDHVQHARRRSPLPYLQWMDILARQGNDAERERVHTAFAERFPVVPSALGMSTEDDDELGQMGKVIGELQARWRDPHDAMMRLERLLLRADDAVPLLDLAAYKDLLFLYVVARDLTVHRKETTEVSRTAVPVSELSLDLEPMTPPSGVSASDGLPPAPTRTAFEPPEPEMALADLSFDLQLAEIDPAPADHKP